MFFQRSPNTIFVGLKALGCVILSLGFVSLDNVHAATVNWPQFRGPNASGVSDEAAPTTWNVETGENIRWQTSIPGLGHACPIIWQDHLFLTTAAKPGSKPNLKVDRK